MKLRPLPFLMTTGLTIWLGMALITTGCGNSPSLATDSNVVDTVTLSAARDTDLTVPSGYSVSGGAARFTQDNPDFDFVYDIDDSGRAVFLTTKVLGVVGSNAVRPGFRKSILHFDSITTAPLNEYVTADTIHADTIPGVAGRVWYIRSGLFCTQISSPYYGKLEVLSIDSVNREIVFRILVDRNCGFHSLRNQLPTY
ncbi:MAG: hypothetical protein ABI765_06405 [Gemmatimonadota bacterium]